MSLERRQIIEDEQDFHHEIVVWGSCLCTTQTKWDIRGKAHCRKRYGSWLSEKETVLNFLLRDQFVLKI